jgi:hypothetical protein
MSMHSELYSDGIGEITITGSIVRLDLVSLSTSERDANNNPKAVLRQRLILSVEAFANSVEVMQRALQPLIDAGVVKRKELKEPPVVRKILSGIEERSPVLVTEGRKPNSSANFP